MATGLYKVDYSYHLQILQLWSTGTTQDCRIIKSILFLSSSDVTTLEYRNNCMIIESRLFLPSSDVTTLEDRNNSGMQDYRK